MLSGPDRIRLIAIENMKGAFGSEGALRFFVRQNTYSLVNWLEVERHFRKTSDFMKTNALSLVLIPLLTCIASLPPAEAVSPPPDGAYPGGNTAEGQSALLNLATGTYNTAVGLYSLLSLTDGNFNTGIGAATLFANTGHENTATGAGALLSNTTAVANTANGAFALVSNTEGVSNTAVGDSALFHNTIGVGNTAIGAFALFLNSADTDRNTAVGIGALGSNATGNANTAVGADALGFATGSGNIALGEAAGEAVLTGDHNIHIGNGGTNADTETIRIGLEGTQTQAFIAGISGTAVVGDPVVVDGNGQLGTATSSARFKKHIKPMDKTSEAVLSLKPVSFQYKSDSKGTQQFGLIAEDVAKVNPDLVVHDRNGEIYSVRYEAVNAMLLNEFLKEHRKNEEQQATMAELKSGMEALTATVKEQAVQIQKVSAQLEVKKSVPQLIARGE